MTSILIISIENKNIKTEEIYWNNKDNIRSQSFKRDKKFLTNLGINDVFFFAVDFNFTKNKVTKKLNRLTDIMPNISECYIMCDRDEETFIDQKIKNQYKKIISEHGDLGIEENEINLLWYKNQNQNFEDFLKAHSENNQLPKNYSKTDKDIYKKIMGINGKNFKILKSNFIKFDGEKNFEKLFRKRKNNVFD